MTTSLTPSALVKIVCMTNKGCKLQYTPANQDALQQALCTAVNELEDAVALNCRLLNAAEFEARKRGDKDLCELLEATHEIHADKLEAIREGRSR